MGADASVSPWRSAAILVGRLIFAAVFLLAVSFKFMGMGDTAGYIAAAGSRCRCCWPGWPPSSNACW